MYILIKSRLASKLELETVYTLDEALKLYALHCMDMDIERGQKLELETVYTLDEALKLYALHCMDMDIERGQAEELKAQQQK